MRHGVTQHRGLHVPPGNTAQHGRFGRMFPNLPPRRPTGLPLAEEYGLPGGRLDAGEITPDKLGPVDTGFVYLAQFIDHNITFDPTTVLNQQVDPEAIQAFRPPRLDLDALYGAGPTVDPYLYDQASHGTKLVLGPGGTDFARTAEGVPLIGDPRNDENMLIAHIHLAYIMIHTGVGEGRAAASPTAGGGARGRSRPAAPGDAPAGRLDDLLSLDNYYNELTYKAQQLVRWHFQWIVVHEYLPLFVGQHIVDDIFENGLRFYDPRPVPYIPVEFAVAAFRVMHSTILPRYQINEKFSAPLFPADRNAPPSPRADLRGGRILPEHSIDWSLFFRTDPNRVPQRAKAFGASLTSALLNLPVSAVPGAKEGALAKSLGSLAVRNMLRSEAQQLPSGQDVARAMGEVPLSDELLDFDGPAYLWYYILKEAEVLTGGHRLGPVGGRLVAEVLLGILKGDPMSYCSAYPAWRPTLAGQNGVFGMVELLRFAGLVPAGRGSGD